MSPVRIRQRRVASVPLRACAALDYATPAAFCLACSMSVRFNCSHILIPPPLPFESAQFYHSTRVRRFAKTSGERNVDNCSLPSLICLRVMDGEKQTAPGRLAAFIIRISKANSLARTESVARLGSVPIWTAPATRRCTEIASWLNGDGFGFRADRKPAEG